MSIFRLALLAVAAVFPLLAWGATGAPDDAGPGARHPPMRRDTPAHRRHPGPPTPAGHRGEHIKGHGFTSPGFGLLYTLGFSSVHSENTATNAHTQLDLGWSGGRWETAFEARATGAWLNGKADSEEYYSKVRANYSLTDSTYVWGWAGYRYNRFAEYQYQANEIVGYGYKPIDSRYRILRLEVGAGGGQDKTRYLGRTHSGIAEMAREVYAQHFGPSGESFLEQQLHFVHTANNTFSEFSLRFVQPIGDGWSVWSGYRLEHNSASVVPGAVQTVSWISLNIGYQFGAERYGF